ncbi:MAG: PAS domain S-box protein, partial [Methylocapsa sp.]|nr:PAS domain S-box protein [Methylocapsa sp.]
PRDLGVWSLPGHMDLDHSATLEGERQFQQLADNVPQLMWLAKPDGWIYWYNKKCYDYTGASPEEVAGWGWQSVIEPRALPELMEGWSRSIATGESFEMVFPIKAANGSFRPFLARVQPLKDDQGRVLRWFGTNTDISEQKHAEEHLQLLLNELNHRVKNTLATVQAIASQSMRTIPRENFEIFSDRLVALSRAHDLLTQSNWKAAGLREIIGQSLAPFYAIGLGGRLTMEGPSVLIPARNAASWSMAIHELCTNAFKHGAFRSDAGKVNIVWSEPEKRRLRFCWIENGGPTVTAPRQRGFGSRLIESLGRELEGSANIHFEPGGLTCVIDAVLPPAPDR